MPPSRPACSPTPKSAPPSNSNSHQTYLVYHYLKQLCFSYHLPLQIRTVDHENHGVRTRVVRRPNRTDTLLTAEIPRTKFHIFVSYLLHVATDSGSCLHRFAQRPKLAGNTSGKAVSSCPRWPDRG